MRFGEAGSAYDAEEEAPPPPGKIATVQESSVVVY
jgi:hypothetical protein